ncbi:MAG: DUF937 domain-containing protein [Saprospiraceae bacterium]|nr:DUF937 domain-containing protein [Saprospiraceae bacterium]
MAMDLMDLLKGQFSDNMVDFLSKQVGGEDHEKTEAATEGIVSTLISALAKNASTPEGANALNNALENDHDGGILDDVVGMLSGNQQPSNQKALDGAGILWHLLGDRQSSAANMIGQMSGMDSGKVNNLMTLLAPVVMGVLGKTKKEQGLNVADLAGLLTQTRTQQANQNPTMALVTRFLDQDGDGSIMDEVASMGMKMLSGFFRRR